MIKLFVILWFVAIARVSAMPFDSEEDEIDLMADFKGNEEMRHENETANNEVENKNYEEVESRSRVGRQTSPYQEAPCAKVGGVCKFDTDCHDGYTTAGLCPKQSNNVKCCRTRETSQGSDDMDQCLRCICNRESGCRNLTCAQDVGSLSCGYFQIKLNYYKDCGKPGWHRGEKELVAWKRCAADKDCSVKCINAYVNRYQSFCPNRSRCEQMARLHNGGPKGCQKPATADYWTAVRNCINP